MRRLVWATVGVGLPTFAAIQLFGMTGWVAVFLVFAYVVGFADGLGQDLSGG